MATAETVQQPMFAEVAAALGLAPAPAAELGTEQASGALSFGAQLAEMGPGLDDSDTILAQFLKLAILSGTNDKVMQYLASQGHSELMLGALEQSMMGYDMAATLQGDSRSLHTQADGLEQQAQAKQQAADQKAAKDGQQAGIDPEAAALFGRAEQLRSAADGIDADAAEWEAAALTNEGIRHANRAGSQAQKVQQKLETDPAQFDRLMRSMAGSDSDGADRDAAIREMDENRNQVAALVLSLVDASADAKRALIGVPIG